MGLYDKWFKWVYFHKTNPFIKWVSKTILTSLEPAVHKHFEASLHKLVNYTQFLN